MAAVTPHLAALLHLSLERGIVVSHHLRQSEFPGKAEIRGEPVLIDGVNVPVGGVAPAWLEGLYRDRAVDLWTPLHENALTAVDRASPNFWVAGRLRRDVPADQAPQRIRAGSREFIVLPYTGVPPELAEGMSRVGTLLAIAAGIVFFVASGNVALFLLGRAFARSRETSLRVALGAGRWQLARALLADTIVISAIGGAAGMVLAAWTAHLLPALLFEQDAERMGFTPDRIGIALSSAACFAITMVCGLLPVCLTPHDRPAAILRRDSAGPSKPVRRLRMLLVVAQMTTCCMLVVATAFLLAGFRSALQTNTGRRLGHPVLATVETADPYVNLQYFRDVERAAQLVAGVSGVAWTGQPPGGNAVWQSFRSEPRQLPSREVNYSAGFRAPVASAPLGIFQRRAEPAIYFPMAQDCRRSMPLILGARGT